MHRVLSNCFIIVLTSCSWCLQGCGSSLQITSGELVPEESRGTSDDAQAPGQGPASDVLSFAFSGGHAVGLPTASPVTLVSASTSVTESEETATKPAARSAAWAAECPSMGCLASLCVSPFSIPAPVFGAGAWHQYFGEVGVAPPLPSEIDEILGGPCPFWPGKRVKDTHLLVLIPATVDGHAFTLDLLEELIQNPRRGGHSARYFLYDDEIQRSSGDVYSSSSYWVLLTRDVLPGSRKKPYAIQQALVAAQSSHVDDFPYAIPNVLEAATAILSHYVRSGDRLYEEASGELPSTSTRCTALLEDVSEHSSLVTVGRFCSRGLVFLSGFGDDAEFGVACLRRLGTRHYRPSALLHSFGTEEWSRYFGTVVEAPPLPVHLVDMLNGTCPFWPEKAVKDTHLLVLIPATVDGKPFSLNLLGELVQCPQGGGYSTKYRVYDSDVREQCGAQSPTRSYWVLLTRDVLSGSRGETYSSQQALVSGHAERTGLRYALPGVLEVATAILLHYVRSGERLYTDAPWTYARCQELVAWNGSHYPVVVGGFSSGGLLVYIDSNVCFFHGVAGLRKIGSL
jgi:hypothetical protein